MKTPKFVLTALNGETGEWDSVYASSGTFGLTNCCDMASKLFKERLAYARRSGVVTVKVLGPIWENNETRLKTFSRRT
jgi:hypothetical protein